MRDREEISNAIFKVVVAILLGVALAILCSSCCPCKHLPHPGAQVKDSLVVHIKDSVALRLIDVNFPIPGERSTETVSAKDTSRLETSVATSIAYIDKNGRLHHELANKPGSLSATVPVEEHYHSADTTHEHSEIRPEIIEIEKPLSWWQSFKIGAFPWLCGAILLLLAWTFRKTIVKLIKK